MKQREPSTITRAQYLQLVGLMALAERHNKHLDEIRKAASEIVNEGEHANCGHISDMIYGSRELDEGLEILKVTVIDEPAPASDS